MTMAGTKNNQCTCCLYGAVQSGFEGGLSITRGILGGGGPKNLDFFGPKWHFVPHHINNRYINS